MICVENITCGYNERRVLEGIDMRISKGQLAGIVGPNGSGKTTLFRVLTKILMPHQGQVSLDGKNLSLLSQKEVSRIIAVVGQQAPAPRMKVEEYVLLGRVPFFQSMQFFETKKDREIAHDAMEVTGVAQYADRDLTQLSGGEQQLVHIARALAQEPKVLLMDEPTAHLDLFHQMQVLKLMKKLHAVHGITIVVVLHDINMAAEHCQQVFVMRKGAVYAEGRPEEVFTPEILREVYGVDVCVRQHPVSKKPWVLIEEKPEYREIKG